MTFLLGLSTLIGTIIGAGIFGIPYLVAHNGPILTMFYFIFLGVTVWLLHLLLGEVCLRTDQSQRLIGFGRIYLGPLGTIILVFTTLFGIIGALLAYIIVGGSFLQILLSPILVIPETAASIVLWALLSLFIMKGIHAIARAEFFMNIALFGAIFLVFLFAAPHVQLSNIPTGNAISPLLPFGVILFALVGWSAIPEVADFFKKKDKGKLDNAISAAAIVTLFFYVTFGFIVAGVSGAETSQDALSGLLPFLGDRIILLGAFFGLVAIAASYLVLGNYLKNSFRYDFSLPLPFSLLIAIGAPLALFLMGARDFIGVLGIVGGVALAIEGIAILLLFAKAKKKGTRVPEYEIRIHGLALWAMGAVLLSGVLLGALFSLSLL